MPTASGSSFSAGVFLAALVVALSYNLLVVGAEGPYPTSDALEYDLLGRTLAGGEGMIGTKRTPLFPAFLAAVYILAGVNHFVARVFLSVMAAGICLLIYRLGRLLTGESAARGAAIMGAVYPPLFLWAGRLNSEIPFTLLTWCFLFYLARSSLGADHVSERRSLVTAGVFLGLATLTRPAGALFYPLIPLWALVSPGRGGWSRVGRSLLVLMPALLVLTPWTYRNYRVTGEFVPLSTLGGTVLLGGNNPTVARGPGYVSGPYGWSKGRWVPPDRTGLLEGDDFARLEALSEVEKDRFYRERALAYVRANPREALGLVAHKFIRLWELIPPRGGARRWFVLAPYYLVLALSLTGAWRARRRWRRLLPLWLALGATLITVALTWGSSRFRHPVEPALLILAGVSVAGFKDWVSRARSPAGGETAAASSAGRSTGGATKELFRRG